MADVDTTKIDFVRASMLLDVVIKSAGAGPKLTSLGNAAMTELTKMNDAIVVASIEAKRKEEAEAHRKRHAPKSNDDPTKPEPDPELQESLSPDGGKPIIRRPIEPVEGES